MAQNKHGIEESPDYTPGLIQPPAPETMKVASDATEQGYVIINAADFDRSSMKKYVEAKAKKGDELLPPAA